MRFDIITIFPEIFRSAFSGGILKRALANELVEVNVHDLRDFAHDKHKQVDDRPYGGAQGMVLKPEPIFAAVEKIREEESTPVFLLSPQGKKLDFKLAESFSGYRQIIMICGRYEGVDERVVQNLATHEISIGDYILTGGEYPALVIIDAVSRFIPGVVGKEESVRYDSFAEGMFDYPLYTRPRDFRGLKVPELLFSGDHKKIEQWRSKKALEKTQKLRPDLLEGSQKSEIRRGRSKK
jgi:tRNA (guanine37-N1)-methyltransferase